MNFSVSHTDGREFCLIQGCAPSTLRNIDEPKLQCLSPLHTFVPGPGGAQTSVHPKEVIIPRGSSVLVNCSTSCDQYTLLGLETHLDKKEVANGPNWQMYELSSVQGDTIPYCYSVCHNNQSEAKMSLTVYCECLGPGAGLGLLGGGVGQGSP